MAARKPKEAKAVVPQRENKAVRPAAANKADGYVRVRVVKAHDGIEEGAVLSRPAAVAQQMINLGYWEAL